jgi:hypothetical protein
MVFRFSVSMQHSVQHELQHRNRFLGPRHHARSCNPMGRPASADLGSEVRTPAVRHPRGREVCCPMRLGEDGERRPEPCPWEPVDRGPYTAIPAVTATFRQPFSRRGEVLTPNIVACAGVKACMQPPAVRGARDEASEAGMRVVVTGRARRGAHRGESGASGLPARVLAGPPQRRRYGAMAPGAGPSRGGSKR